METLYLDKEGTWYHEGVEITHERTCSLFYKHLMKEADGHYSIRIGNEYAQVRVEDAPYIVRSIHMVMDPNQEIADYQLLLSDGTNELLDPKTLFVGKENVLYCRVKGGEYRARFSRPAYQLLCSNIEFDEANNQYWIPWQKRRVYIPQTGNHPDHESK